jgi:hypothetical protein
VNSKSDTVPALASEQGNKESLYRALGAARNSETTARIQLQAAERALGPDPGEVLKMVAILGALGGLIHLITSLVTYIGNRQLVQRVGQTPHRAGAGLLRGNTRETQESSLQPPRVMNPDRSR